jgi:hypothetical protein
MQRLTKKQEKTLDHLIFYRKYKDILKFIKSKNGKTDDRSLIDFYETGKIATKKLRPKNRILSENEINAIIKKFDRFIHTKEEDVINKKIKVPSNKNLEIWLNR